MNYDANIVNYDRIDFYNTGHWLPGSLTTLTLVSSTQTGILLKAAGLSGVKRSNPDGIDVWQVSLLKWNAGTSEKQTRREGRGFDSRPGAELLCSLSSQLAQQQEILN